MAKTRAQLLAEVSADITTNGVGLITGAILNGNLTDIISAMQTFSSQVVTTAPGSIITGLPTDDDVLIDLSAPGPVTYMAVAAALATGPVGVKDYAGNASTYNITITPHGAETIDGLSGSLTIGVDGGAVTLYPLPGIGWYRK